MLSSCSQSQNLNLSLRIGAASVAEILDSRNPVPHDDDATLSLAVLDFGRVVVVAKVGSLPP